MEPEGDARTVKSLYLAVKPIRQWRPNLWRRQHILSDNLTLSRRQNALQLFQEFAEQALAGGAPPKGLEQAFAARLQISPSMWSQIKSARPIGDKLARQIEVLCGRPAGWLDEARAASTPSAAELAFLDLALQVWRGSNAQGRRELLRQLKTLLAAPR